jgi:signal-transduction protein with cAMP-binding, CBS, and nucleotidyltransferase domain
MLIQTDLKIKRKTSYTYKMLPRAFARTFSSRNTPVSALEVFNKSCYHKIDFKINQNSSVQEAVIRFSAFNVGCLAVTNHSNKVVGVVSERDFINKVASVGKDSEKTQINEICTMSPNIIIAKKTDSLDECMNKMMFKDIRHLLILDETNPDFVGLISIKDLIREINIKNHDLITRLSDFRIGKGAFFGSE